MIDLSFSYDFQIFLNGTTPVGILHSFNSNMIDLRFVNVSFEIKKKRLGRQMTNIRIV